MSSRLTLFRVFGGDTFPLDTNVYCLWATLLVLFEWLVSLEFTALRVCKSECGFV